uniref:Uncharacterized protein n=2 Tax=Odontella aurita TaxID=265563 RepID=A0A7S4JE04_9STRA|mmetsp:Transcript_44643/g.136175  ORF Transcript_44643/g.136175 Transcript_44643/m.136175 type:complete len:533 (+) Transcript_44643:313-1911(+)
MNSVGSSIEMMKVVVSSAVTLALLLVGQLALSSATVISSLSDLPYDENGRLSTHLLVYPKPCEKYFGKSLTYDTYGREIHAVIGDALFSFFGETDEDYAAKEQESGGLGKTECRAACVERGVERSVVHGVMPIYRFEGSTEARNIGGWLHESCQKVEYGFINYHRPDVRKPINMYWVDSKGKRHSRGELEWGERKTHFFGTFLGHRWLFEDPETEEVLMDHVVEFHGTRTIGRHPSLIDSSANYTDEIRSALATEWNKHKKVTRTFSKLGFGRGRLPDDLFASMAAFNYNNKDYSALEEWTGGKGVFVNWWERDFFLIQAPWDLKLIWQTRIKDLVEKWAGVELENTSLYGLRRYEEGARLLTHVDRINTHAASVIINVAQGNVAKPWTIEVYDHADRLHEVVMEPGDIVYYESAKCLHSRNTPLQGEGAYYVNMFSHYRPVGDAEWYMRPNPEGTPEPLLDVGECRLEGSADEYSQGAVKCDNPAIGPHLSPSVPIATPATSGRDLFDWWKKVGEVSSEGTVGGNDRHEEL